MTFDVNTTLTGLQEMQAANLRRIALLQPDGALGRLVRDVTVELHRYAVGITHVGQAGRPLPSSTGQLEYVASSACTRADAGAGAEVDPLIRRWPHPGGGPPSAPDRAAACPKSSATSHIAPPDS